MGINDILHTARSGMMVSQTGLRVTGNNVSNVNTPGYSRQRLDIQSLGGSALMPGIGANVADVRRVHDQFLERQSNEQRGAFGFMDGRNFIAGQLDTIFLELDDNGVNRAVNDFFNSIRELSNTPSGVAERRMVIYHAQTLAERLNTTAANLENLQRNLNESIAADVKAANALLGELASLNGKLAAFNNPEGRGEASELLDRRDQVVRELHALVGGQTFKDASGAVNFMLANRVIVEGANAGSLGVIPGPVSGISLTTIAGNTTDITAFLQADGGLGHLSGLVYERDVIVGGLAAQLDEFAFTFANAFNAIHQTGFGLDGLDGRDFFQAPAGLSGAAKDFRVRQGILDNPDEIGAAQDPGSLAGDNRVLNLLADLQNDETVMGGRSFNQFFNDIVNRASTEANHVSNELTYRQAVLDQADAYRDSVSGVSVDEEMVSLIQYQRAFEASAKMIATVDQMLQTVISLKQ
jgi:flagellar hook-associated protein 1 FlgK